MYDVILNLSSIVAIFTKSTMMTIQTNPDHMPLRSYLLGAICALIAKEIYRKSQKYHEEIFDFEKIIKNTSGIACKRDVVESFALRRRVMISLPFGKIKYIKSVSIPTPKIIGAAPIKKLPSV